MSGFVSRESELEKLSGVLERALDGGPPIAFVTGEAGSGKTALLTAFTGAAQDRNAEIVFAAGDCNAQTGIADPYLPFREVLAQLTGDVDGKLGDGRISDENASRLSRTLEVTGRALVEHAPDLIDILVPGGALLTRLGKRAVQRFQWARRLSEISAGRLARGAATEGLEQSHVFQQCTSLLRAVAADRPLVLVLDDLHWVDPASAALLFHLARRLEGDRVLILGAFRPGDVALDRGGERHPLEPVLTELKRYHGDILARLGEEDNDGRRFVDALVAAEMPGMDSAFREELFRHTGGHPLFCVELLRHLKESGGLAIDGVGRWRAAGPVDWDALPPRVEGLIQERAQRLEPEQRELLAAASVAGEEFAAEVVSAAVSRELRDVLRELSGPLEKRHGMVRALGLRRANGRRLAVYRFRHNLFQTWFYQQLDPIERAYLHDDIGRSLESLYAAAPEQVAVRLAWHFVEADQTEAALRYLLMAADRARATFANAEAGLRYSEAARLLESAGAELDDALARNARGRISEGLGDLAELAARHQEAIDHYERAAAELDPAVHRVRFARLIRKKAKPLELQRLLDEADHLLHDAESALGDPPGEDAPEWWDEWLRILLERIWVNYWRGELPEMREAAARARPVVERRGSPLHRARFHNCEALMAFRAERFHPSGQTLAPGHRALEASRQGGTQAEIGMTQFQLGFTQMWRLELNEAERNLEKAREIAETLGDATLLARILVYLSMTRRLMGDVEGAERWTEPARRAAESAGLLEYVGTIHAQRSWVALRRGDSAAARAEATAALEVWDPMPFTYPMRPLALLPIIALEAGGGELSGALELIREILAPPCCGFRTPCGTSCRPQPRRGPATTRRRRVPRCTPLSRPPGSLITCNQARWISGPRVP
jgi:tetratricopeptide (TPR) repeat protein